MKRVSCNRNLPTMVATFSPSALGFDNPKFWTFGFSDYLKYKLLNLPGLRKMHDT